MEKHYYEKIIKIPIYKGQLVFVLTNDNKKINKKVPDFKEKTELYGHALNMMYEKEASYIIVLNSKHTHSRMTVGVMAHEAVHIADFIFTNCGITHDLDNDEPFAYLVEWITNELYEFYKEFFYGL